MRKMIILTGFIIVFLFPGVARASSGGFDYPVGKPNALGYYDAQGFGGTNDILPGYHLGEDWNGKCAGDCDLGDPVYSIADGTVDQVASLRVWGNVVMIKHQINEKNYKSLYAHLKDVYVTNNQPVSKGQIIGTIGKGDRNVFAAHLHFEIRDNVSIGIGTGYGSYKPAGWLDPTDFINSHRPPKSPILTVTTGESQANISWTKLDDPQFDHYEIYRSPAAGGTTDPLNRTLIYSGKDPSTISTVDDKIPIGRSYYRLFTYIKNGMVAESNEVSVEIKRQVTQITTSTGYQGSPIVINGKVFFEDTTPYGNNYNKSLFYYDLNTKQTSSVDIPNGATYAHQPQGSDQKITYYSPDRYGCNRVYYYDFVTAQNLPVSIADGSCTQYNPDISNYGVVVWQQKGSGNLYKVYLNDTSGANGPTQVSNYASDQIYPRISGNNLIWKDSRNSSSYDIYLKNISQSGESKLAINTGNGAPDIWEKYVVWEYKGKITLIDIETKEQKVIVQTGGGYGPTVNEGKVAYTLLEGSNSFVHVYDIGTGHDTKIDHQLHAMSYPAFGAGYIAFDDTLTWPSTNKDVFLVKF